MAAVTPGTFVFCSPPSGKPNPDQSINLKKPRDRILQKEAKGDTSMFYAMHRIRRRIGKKGLNPNSEEDRNLRINEIEKVS